MVNKTTSVGQSQTGQPCAMDERLPCYVNGSLPAAEMAGIESHIASCQLCQASVAELELLAQAVARAGVTPIVPEPDVAGLQRRIDALESRRRWKRPLAHAAGVALLGLLALLAIEATRQERAPLYETATSVGDTASVDYVLDIKFARATTVSARIDAVRAVVDTQSVEALDETTLRIVVRQQAASLSALTELTARLSSAEGVESAEIVALHAE